MISKMVQIIELNNNIITNFDAYEKDPNESQGCRFIIHSCLRGPSRLTRVPCSTHTIQKTFQNMNE